MTPGTRGERWAHNGAERYTLPIMFSGDTDDKARAMQLAVLRRLGPSERVRIAAEMSEDARRIAIEGELRRRPALSPTDARQAVLDRLWGTTLADAVRRARAQHHGE